ncbi:MAG: hypothetical protein PWQ91_622 [Eubacteriales bacterium]|nr:hypothetical protein [Eubacteriales bacterium]
MIKKWQVSLALVMIVLGVFLSSQFHTQQTITRELKYQKKEDLMALAMNLREKNLELMREEADLKNQLELLEKSANENSTLRQSIQAEIQKLDIALGLLPVQGQGITIIFPDSDPGVNNLVLLINELWNTGAEAIAVNDTRITDRTRFGIDRDTGLTTIDGQVISAPLIIKAIGPDTMYSGINLNGGILDKLKIYYSIKVEVKQADKIYIPAATTPPTLKFARPVKQ